LLDNTKNQLDKAFTQAKKIQKIVKIRWKRWYDWPFKEIDKITQWIIEWKVYTIWAYSNTWKSQLSYEYASFFLKQWKKVMFVSTETSIWELVLYVSRNFYRENYFNIQNWDFKIKQDDLKNFIPFDDVFSLDDINKKIHEYKPDIVFIDFIQSIQAPWTSDYERLSNLAVWIQKTAIQNNITIFSLSQVNNDSRNTTNIVLKWSWWLFASSDIVIWLLFENWERKLKIVKNKFWKVWDMFLIEFNFINWEIKLVKDFNNNEY
jgi:predicted ATP-dependent serine protease